MNWNFPWHRNQVKYSRISQSPLKSTAPPKMPAYCSCSHICLLRSDLSLFWSSGLDVKHSLFQILKIKVKHNTEHSHKLFMYAVRFNWRERGYEKGFYTEARQTDSSHRKGCPTPRKSLECSSESATIPHSTQPPSLLSPLPSLLSLILQSKLSFVVFYLPAFQLCPGVPVSNLEQGFLCSINK